MTVNEKHLELAQELPEEVRNNAVDLVEMMGQEIEGIGDKPITWSPPYLTLVQNTSDMDKLPEGASPGTLVLEDDVYKEGLEIIPIRLWYSRSYWDMDHESNQRLCHSPDGNLGFINRQCRTCEFSKFHEELGKSPCSLEITTLNMLSDLSKLFYTTFTKTNYDNGRRFRTMMQKAAVDPYKRIYRFSPAKHPKHTNVKMIEVKPLSGSEKYTPKEYIPFLNAIASQISEDRKNFLDEFYQMVKQRSEEGTLPVLESLSEDNDDNTKVIEHQSEGAVSEKSKKYSL